MLVEMVGMVGAGKTTLGAALSEYLGKRGLVVMSVEDAIQVVLGRSWFGSVLRRIVPAAARRRMLTAGYKLVVRPWHSLRFVAANPALTRMAMRALMRSPLPSWHRRKIFGLYLRPGAAAHYFRPRLRPQEVLLLEEGLVHRAVNLHAWSARDVDAVAIEAYLSTAPATDLVVLVSASLATCRERIDDRGLPARLDGHDDATVERFMTNACGVVDLVATFLKVSARPSLVLHNDGPFDETVEEMQVAIDTHLAETPSLRAAGGGGGAPRTTPRYRGGLRIPRPGRWTSQRSRPRPAAFAHDDVTDLLAMFGLEASGDLSIPGATSRADNVIVPTAAGTKLLKRYKMSVTEPAIALEHSVLAYLATMDFPAPRLVATPDGATAVLRDDRWYAIFDYHSGFFQYQQYLWLPRSRLKLVGMSARALASLHHVLGDFSPQGANPNGFASLSGDRVRGIEWYLDAIDRARTGVGDKRGPGPEVLRSMLDGHAVSLEKQLRSLGSELASADLPRGVIHGDYGPYNLLFKRGERIIILDFELARVDWRVADVAKSLQQFGVNRQGLQFPRIARFVTEYHQAFPLGPDELRLIPDVWLFLTLRRIAVCWARFTESGNDRWLVEAERKLDLAEMIREAADKLSALRGPA